MEPWWASKLFITVIIDVLILTVISLPAKDPNASTNTTLIEQYLTKYGYGEPKTEGQLHTALTKLQLFMDIPTTGLLNKATLDRTTRLRCKVPDPASKILELNTMPRFLHSNSHWNKGSLFYNILGNKQQEVISAIGDAVQAWGSTTSLNFGYHGQQQQIDIQIEMVSNPNDITSVFGTDQIDFGWAFPPPNGTIQLNGEHEYATSHDPPDSAGYSIKHIVMHEIGHALGLEHVPGSASIMNPYYEIFSQLSEPQENDISGIKALYVLCPESQTETDGRTLTWPSTMKDTTAGSNEVCPEYSLNAGTPLAFRFCRQNTVNMVTTAEWDEPTNFTACLEGDPNQHVENLAKVMVNETNVAEIANALAEITNDTAHITSNGLDAIADTLENIAAVREPSTEVTSSVVATVNNVLAVDEEQIENTPDEKAPSKIIQSLERQIRTLQLDGGNFTEIRENIGVKAFNYPISSLQSPLVFAKLMPSTNETSVGINDENIQVFYSPEEFPKNRTETSIRLPTEIIDRFLEKKNDWAVDNITTIPVTFTIFERTSLFVPYTTENQQPKGKERREENMASIHQCATKGVKVGDVQGSVISASVEGVRMLQLNESVKISFRSQKVKSQTSDYEANLRCVYWNFRRGNWAPFACKLEEIKPNGQIVCACSHLTNFAVVLTPYGNAISHRGFDIFNSIAICLSIVGLLITIVMYLLIPKLRKQPSLQVHINFMVSLTCLYVVFLCGIDQTSSPDGCICVAVLLHYFTLSTVFLMGAEAITMFYLFVSIKGQQGGIKQIPHYVFKVAAVAWGVPLLVVIVTVASSYCQYFNTDYCFLPSGKPLYFGEILPIGVVLLTNLLIFSLVARKITCQRKFKKKNDKKKKQKEAVRQFYRVLSLFTVLGLSWIFGLLSIIYSVRFIFQILFAVFTTLQGVFIFMLFCVRHQDVIATWKRWARRVNKGGKRGGNENDRSENATAYRTPTSPNMSTTVSPIAMHPAKSFFPSSSS